MEITGTKRQFLFVNRASVLILFVLILAGGVVRSTGSGMGCPDWPKCFDQYVPPTSVNQIPKNYKDKYVAKRELKNQKFAHVLDVFGYTDLALRIRNDKSILLPEDFNAAKTWTEYINRLIGAVSGVFLLLTAVYSFSYFKIKKRIAFVSVTNVFLVGFQGWLGAIVVSTNLVEWIVTVHMLLALVIVALCIYSYHAATIINNSYAVSSKFVMKLLTILALLVSIIQIEVGTEVRERIDVVSGRLQGLSRETWITESGDVFSNHRDLALLVLVVNVALYALMRKSFNRHSIQQQLMSFVFLLIMLQMVSGVVLSYGALPPAAQCVHVVLASLIFGAQFYLLLNMNKSVKDWGSIA